MIRPLLCAAALTGAAMPAMATDLSSGRTAKTNYILRCVGCHGVDGHGLTEVGIPDFVNLIGTFAADEAGRAYLANVPNVVGSGLNEPDVAEVLNFIVETWAGTSLPEDYQPFDGDEVAYLRGLEVGNIVDYRREVVAELADRGIETAVYPWP
ncbi:c-type cytochrome [Pseudoroseicyclus sp. H15]